MNPFLKNYSYLLKIYKCLIRTGNMTHCFVFQLVFRLARFDQTNKDTRTKFDGAANENIISKK